MMSNKRKYPLYENTIFVERPPQVDYSFACFICGVVLTSREGFGKHKRSHHCCNYLHQLLHTKSMGGSSFPKPIHRLVFSDQVSYLLKADQLEPEDFKKLKKCIKKAGHASISKVFDSMFRYVNMLKYSMADYYVNFNLSTFLLDLPMHNIDSYEPPKGKIVINTPTGSIGDCIQFLVGIYFPLFISN